MFLLNIWTSLFSMKLFFSGLSYTLSWGGSWVVKFFFCFFLSFFGCCEACELAWVNGDTLSLMFIFFVCREIIGARVAFIVWSALRVWLLDPMLWPKIFWETIGERPALKVWLFDDRLSCLTMLCLPATWLTRMLDKSWCWTGVDMSTS